MSDQDIGRMFAELTALLEDMHGITVEGHRRDATRCERLALAQGVSDCIERVNQTLHTIYAALDA